MPQSCPSPRRHKYTNVPNPTPSATARLSCLLSPHGADPLHLALVFGIDEKTAIRYADSARQLLQADLEAGVSPR